jgi:hypothetical protein
MLMYVGLGRDPLSAFFPGPRKRTRHLSQLLVAAIGNFVTCVSEHLALCA